MAKARYFIPPTGDGGPTGRAIVLPRQAALEKPITAIATPNPKILNAIAEVSRELVLDAAKVGMAEPYSFGRSINKPTVIAGDDSGDTLVLDLLWSVGEVSNLCNGAGGYLKALWMPDVGFVSVSNGALHEHFVGTAGQAASTIMTTLKGSYDALPNKAHSVISMQDGWNLNILAFNDGVKVWDPRQSPQANVFTENPALILADIFSRCGYTVDWDSVAEAANYGDEGIDNYESPLAARWKINGQITNRQELRYWVQTLAVYAGCYIDVRGGSAIFVVDKARASNHTVVKADIVDGTARLNGRSSKNTPDKVTVTFSGGFGSTTASASYGTSGGPGTDTELNMPYWDNYFCAGRKAKEIHAKAQHAIESFEFVGFDDGLIRTLGDVGVITYAPLGLSSVSMALVENQPTERGRWRRKYEPYAAGDYTDSVAGVSEGDAGESLNNPYSPPAGPTPSLSFDLVTTDSPNWQRIKIDFSPQTWAYLKDYKVTVTTTADTDTILYSEYIAKGSETGSPETITTYTDFATDFTGSPVNVYQVNVYLRSIVVDWQGNEVLGTPGTATIDNSYVTTAKELGSSTSPITNYYHIPFTSPLSLNHLISSTGPTDYVTDFTIVFSVYTLETGRTAYLFEGDPFYLRASNASGLYNFSVFAEDEDSQNNFVQAFTFHTSPNESPVFKPNQWVSVMFSRSANPAVSPETQGCQLYVNGQNIQLTPNDAASPLSGFFSPDATNPGRSNLKPFALNGDAGVGVSLTGAGVPNSPGLNCYLSHVWANAEYLDPATNWSKFFDGDNKPIDLGADGSTPTGVAPESFFPDADFTNNRGTGPNWTEVGTVPDAPISPTD